MSDSSIQAVYSAIGKHRGYLSTTVIEYLKKRKEGRKRRSGEENRGANLRRQFSKAFGENIFILNLGTHVVL